MGRYQGFNYEEYDDVFPEEGDMLSNLFKMQETLQKRLKVSINTQEYREKMLIALIDEAMEAMRETPWKPWKKQQSFNKENFKKEVIDIWHFVINLSLAAGLSSEQLYHEFIQKNIENHRRQTRGY